VNLKPSPDLRARVLEAALREPARTRASGIRRSASVIAAGFAGPVAISLYFQGPLLGGRPQGYVVALAAAWASIAGWATWGGVSRGRSMLGRPVGHRVSIALIVPWALVATSLLANVAWPRTIDGRGTALAAWGVCAAFTLLFALGPFVAFAAMRRNSDPVSPRLTGAALGAAAGAWGALGIELHCNKATPWHVVLGHELPVFLLVVVGIAVGDRIVRVVAVRTENEQLP
jgi:hypothetical protein